VWILFLEKDKIFENLRKALLDYPWHVAYRYNDKFYVIRLKAHNWQYASQLIAEN